MQCHLLLCDIFLPIVTLANLVLHLIIVAMYYYYSTNQKFRFTKKKEELNSSERDVYRLTIYASLLTIWPSSISPRIKVLVIMYLQR